MNVVCAQRREGCGSLFCEDFGGSARHLGVHDVQPKGQNQSEGPFAPHSVTSPPHSAHRVICLGRRSFSEWPRR